jgi:AcrR family transcriptional regulator
MTDSTDAHLLDNGTNGPASADGSAPGTRPVVNSSSAEANRIETRDRIVAAAAEVFLEKGFTGTRVVDIARRAGFTSGALYAYFESRAELLAEAVGDASGEVLDHVFDSERQGDVSLADLLTAALAQVTKPLEASGQMLLDGVALSQREPTVGKRLAAALANTAPGGVGEGAVSGEDNAAGEPIGAGAGGDRLTSTQQELLVILILGVTAARALGLHNPLPEDLGDALASAVTPRPGSR